MNYLQKALREQAEKMGLEIKFQDNKATHIELSIPGTGTTVRATFGGGHFFVAADDLDPTGGFDTASEAFAFAAGYIKAKQRVVQAINKRAVK